MTENIPKTNSQKPKKKTTIIDYDTAEAVRESTLEKYRRIIEQIETFLKEEKPPKKVQL